jgi:uncharacterized membrane protein YhaH (DUF805 family)
MDYKWLLFRFEGRINRARYWLATLVILGSMLFALLLQAAICLGFGIPTGPLNINIIGISASFQLADEEVTSKAGLFPQIATTLMMLLFAWCYAAVSIKRLHDRDKSGWWMIPFVAASGVYGQFGDGLGGSWTAAFLGLAVFVAFIWGVVEMYFLKGSSGPNRFGPDPLAPIDTRPRWNQQSELEFVPYSAGPSPGAHVKRGA